MKRKKRAALYDFPPKLQGYAIRIDNVNKSCTVVSYAIRPRVSYWACFGDFPLGRLAISLKKGKAEKEVQE